MSNTLKTAVREEQLTAIPSRAPSQLVRCGQTWMDDKPHCYKCHHFRTNQHNSGACALGNIGGSILSQDYARGDFCAGDYSPKWTEEDGLTLPPVQTDEGTHHV